MSLYLSLIKMRQGILLSGLLSLSACENLEASKPSEPFVELLLDPELAKNCLKEVDERTGERKEFDHPDVQKVQALTRGRLFTDCLERSGVVLKAVPPLTIY